MTPFLKIKGNYINLKFIGKIERVVRTVYVYNSDWSKSDSYVFESEEEAISVILEIES